MQHAIDTYRRLIAVRIRSQLQYRVSALLDIVAMAIVTGVEFGALALVFQRFDTIAGWTLGEVAFLYGIVTASFGTMDLIFGGFDPDTFGPLVQRGTLDQLLLSLHFALFRTRFSPSTLSLSKGAAWANPHPSTGSGCLSGYTLWTISSRMRNIGFVVLSDEGCVGVASCTLSDTRSRVRCRCPRSCRASCLLPWLVI